MKTKKTVIFMGYSCNNNCLFCCHSERRKNIIDKNIDHIKKDLIKARKEGSDYVELIGGEPTIRKDIFKIVYFAKKLRFKTIMFATNGRMFSNLEFAKKIIEKGVNHIVFSIHGHNSRLHDELTNTKGSFNQLLMGIKNLKKIGFKNIGSNTTIIKSNYKHLYEIGKKIFALGIRNSEYIFVDPSHGAPKNNFFKIVPTYEEVSPYVNQLLEFGKKRKIKHWHIRYYPLCFVDKKYHRLISEIEENTKFKTKHIAPDFINEDASHSRRNIGRKLISKCKNCEFKDICEGYWQEYVKYYPDKNEGYTKFFNDIKKAYNDRESNIIQIEKIFFNFYNNNVLNQHKPLEYSVKISKKGFHPLRFIFFSRDIEEGQFNKNIIQLLQDLFNFKIDLLPYYKYAIGYDILEDSIIKKIYFWIHKKENKKDLFKKIKDKYNIKYNLKFPIEDLEIFSIKENGNLREYDFYTYFKQSNDPINDGVKQKLPIQILQKKDSVEKIFQAYQLTTEEKTKILSQNIFIYYLIIKNLSLFKNNRLNLSYFSQSENSIKFYFKVGSDSKIDVSNLTYFPVYNRFHINLTQECNLNCNYCFVPKTKNKIDIKVLNTILDLFCMVNSKIKFLGLMGGEPLIFKKELNIFLKSISNKIQNKGDLSLHVITNGTLLEANILKNIFNNNFLLSISVDGDRNTHDYNRKFINGTGSYDSIIKKREILKDYKDKLICCPVIDEKNSKILHKNIDSIIKNLNINNFFLECLMNKYWNNEKIIIFKKNLEYFFVWFLKKIEKKEFIYIVQLSKIILRRFNLIDDINTLNFFPNGDFSNSCWDYYKNKKKMGNIFRLGLKTQKIVPNIIVGESVLKDLINVNADIIIKNQSKDCYNLYIQNILKNRFNIL